MEVVLIVIFALLGTAIGSFLNVCIDRLPVGKSLRYPPSHCDASIRLMVTHDNRIRKWADLPLEPGLVKNSVVIKEAEVAAKIKQLFKDRKVKVKKVIVGLSGLHCLSRPITLPQLPKEMLDEAVRREAKRVLPVPLEQLYISWQTIPAPEGKIHVFLVAVPCKTADALLKVLRQAGLKPY
ncbi:unnamed protein product, partial [marine sediment metagenome]